MNIKCILTLLQIDLSLILIATILCYTIQNSVTVYHVKINMPYFNTYIKLYIGCIRLYMYLNVFHKS